MVTDGSDGERASAQCAWEKENPNSRTAMPLPLPVFDRLPYPNLAGGGLGDLVSCVCVCVMVVGQRVDRCGWCLMKELRPFLVYAHCKWTRTGKSEDLGTGPTPHPSPNPNPNPYHLAYNVEMWQRAVYLNLFDCRSLLVQTWRISNPPPPYNQLQNITL